MASNKTGVLLINLGTPDDPSVSSVRRYLRQFLSDPRVIDLPAIPRALLLHLVILPFRPKKSAEAYRKIWTEEGSPLLFHTRKLAKEVQARLGAEISVRFAMRYQNPSIPSVLEAFAREGVERLVVLPLYPQYASSSTGSCLEVLYQAGSKLWNAPSFAVIPAFYAHPAYLSSLIEICKQSIGDPSAYDHFLISFHGLPERQLKKSEVSAGFCRFDQACCASVGDGNRYCYRAQSYETARQLTKQLGIPEDRYSVSFQSRLGRTPWIRPYTDLVIEELARKGVKRLAVMIPSFTADCLETLEEIAIRGKESFIAAGGQELEMVPSLNSHPLWVEAVAQMIAEQMAVPLA